MAFWLVFAGEHLINDDDTLGRYHGLLGYWKNLSVVMFGCLCLFIFDLCERGVQLKVNSLLFCNFNKGLLEKWPFVAFLKRPQKFAKKSPTFLTLLINHQIKWEFFSNLVAFSQYLNFIRVFRSFLQESFFIGCEKNWGSKGGGAKSAHPGWNRGN